jgi:hypothetical protein
LKRKKKRKFISILFFGPVKKWKCVKDV